MNNQFIVYLNSAENNMKSINHKLRKNNFGDKVEACEDARVLKIVSDILLGDNEFVELAMQTTEGIVISRNLDAVKSEINQLATDVCDRDDHEPRDHEEAIALSTVISKRSGAE